MKTIELTRGKVALVDDKDFEWLNLHSWHAVKGQNTWYARRSVKLASGRWTNLYMHNSILGGRADHQNHDGLDNQRVNIRLATYGQNGRAFKTKALKCSSKYRGVDWHQHQWRAQIAASGKKKFLGYFTDEKEAAQAYDTAALARDSKFFHLNFP